jgi:acetyl-CoA carboxylase biotin carboxylase subunit
MEMNTRIQVEHPVTEQVYGLDLLRLQIKLAAGDKLDRRQEDVFPKFHAIECRVNAEDPARNYMPSPGRVGMYIPPGGPGVRVDSQLFPGYTIPPNYDSLIAKIITWGNNRDEAITRMRRALSETIIEGVKTTIPLFLKILDHSQFRSGRVDTGFLEAHIKDMHDDGSV